MCKWVPKNFRVTKYKLFSFSISLNDYFLHLGVLSFEDTLTIYLYTCVVMAINKFMSDFGLPCLKVKNFFLYYKKKYQWNTIFIEVENMVKFIKATISTVHYTRCFSDSIGTHHKTLLSITGQVALSHDIFSNCLHLSEMI